MSNHIKSADLCDRCKYSKCKRTNAVCWSSRKSECCPMFHVLFGCRCYTVADNTPCPYFSEDDDSG